MGLFKFAAIVAVGVSLLPTEREKQEQLYQRAASAASWTITFCDRNAATCSNASNLWSEFSKKAEFGAKLALDVIRENETTAAKSTFQPPAYQPASSQPSPRSLEYPASGTLTREDMKPLWRGKVAARAGT